MRNVELLRTDSDPLGSWLFRPLVRSRMRLLQQRLEDSQFREIEQGFRPSGGMVSGDELSSRLQVRLDQPISTIARWVVDRTVVSLSWRSQTMLPLFQFDVATMAPRMAVTRTIDELRDILDDWDLAMWFARPNPGLCDFSPGNLIGLDDAAVLNAARADRFIARCQVDDEP